MRKILYFVDETGKDVSAKSYIVSVVMSERAQHLESICQHYEHVSKKYSRSWNDASPIRRLEYLRRVIDDPRFIGKLHFWQIENPKSSLFDAYTIQAIISTISQISNVSSAEVYVDALSIKKQSEYSIAIRRSGIRSTRLHRATDDAFPLVRLADAVAGLTRDVFEDGETEATRLFYRGVSKGVIIRVR